LIGFNIWPILIFVAGAVLAYEIIDVLINKFAYALAKSRADSNEEINAKIEIMMQRMETIENKIDRINSILEKVSE
jgi:hypothetical protein